MTDQSAAMNQGRKSHRSQSGEWQFFKIAFPVSVLKHAGKNRFREPSVKPGKLPLVFHMLQVIIKYGDVANPVFNRFPSGDSQWCKMDCVSAQVEPFPFVPVT